MFVDLTQQRKDITKIFKETRKILFSTTVLLLLTDKCVVSIISSQLTVEMLCSDSEVLINVPSDFSRAHSHFEWTENSGNPLIDTQKTMSKSAQSSDSYIVPGLRLLRMTVSLGWGEITQCRCCYSTVRQEPPQAFICSQLQDGKHKGMRVRKIWVPAGRMRTKAPLWTSYGNDWALDSHRWRTLRVCWLALKFC